jgi:hypothetical protein
MGWIEGRAPRRVFGSRNSITDSDQGRSFQALFDFLLSHQRQAELTELLDRLAAIQDIGEHDSRLRHLHFDWIDAGERTQATVRGLSEQLRRFLNDQVWLENRRVFDLLRSIESQGCGAPPLSAAAREGVGRCGCNHHAALRASALRPSAGIEPQL